MIVVRAFHEIADLWSDAHCQTAARYQPASAVRLRVSRRSISATESSLNGPHFEGAWPFRVYSSGVSRRAAASARRVAARRPHDEGPPARIGRSVSRRTSVASSEAAVRRAARVTDHFAGKKRPARRKRHGPLAPNSARTSSGCGPRRLEWRAPVRGLESCCSTPTTACRRRRRSPRVVSQWVDVEVAAVPSLGAEPRAVARNRSFSQLVGASLSSIRRRRLVRARSTSTSSADARARAHPRLSALAGRARRCAVLRARAPVAWRSSRARSSAGVAKLSHMLAEAVGGAEGATRGATTAADPPRARCSTRCSARSEGVARRGGEAARGARQLARDALGRRARRRRQAPRWPRRAAPARERAAPREHARGAAGGGDDGARPAAQQHYPTSSWRRRGPLLGTAAAAVTRAARGKARRPRRRKPAGGGAPKELRPSWFAPARRYPWNDRRRAARAPRRRRRPPTRGGGVAIAEHEYSLRPCPRASARAAPPIRAGVRRFALPSPPPRRRRCYASATNSPPAARRVAAENRREGGSPAPASSARRRASAASAATFMKEPPSADGGDNIYRRARPAPYAENATSASGPRRRPARARPPPPVAERQPPPDAAGAREEAEPKNGGARRRLPSCRVAAAAGFERDGGALAGV